MSLLIRALISSWGSTIMTSSKPTYFPKALPTHTITLGVRAQYVKFGGYIQSITVRVLQREHTFAKHWGH